MSEFCLFSFCNTKISEFFDMAKYWAARFCRLPKQVTGSAERLRYLKSLSYNSVAELRLINYVANLSFLLGSIVRLL